MNKLLKVLLIILFLVILGEFGYYFYIIKKENPALDKLNEENVNSDNSSADSSAKYIPTTIPRPPDALVPQEVLNYLAIAKKNPNEKFTLRNEIDGFVGELIDNEEQNTYILKIVDSQGNKITNYVLRKDKIDDYRVYFVEGDVKTVQPVDKILPKDKVQVLDEHELRDNIISINFYISR